MNRTKWCAIGAVYILLTAILIIHPRQETLYLLIFTQTQLLINLNAYRIRDSAFKGANWVRRSVYFFSYLIAYSFFSSPSLEKGNLIISFSLALLAGLIFLIPRFGEIKPFYNKDLTLFFPLEFKCSLFGGVFIPLFRSPAGIVLQSICNSFINAIDRSCSSCNNLRFTVRI